MHHASYSKVGAVSKVCAPEVHQMAEEASVARLILSCLVPVEPVELAVMAVCVVVASLTAATQLIRACMISQF